MPEESLTLLGVSWRLFLTLFFVGLNGFFVAAEFALVKVRMTRIEALAEEGVGAAAGTLAVLKNLDRYLSACQLGITIASLILGWLAEPAIASLVLAGFHAAGLSLSPEVAHGIGIAVALSVVTILHVTLGEQAPKIFAIQHAEAVALRLTGPLRLFTALLGPAITMLNATSNGLLRLLGIKSGHEHDGVISREELSAILVSSARAGTISPRQREFAENILNMMSLEVRHILVPRIDAAYLSLEDSFEENLEKIRRSAHSRLPLCRDDLDSVIGIVHVRAVLQAVSSGASQDLEKLARPHAVVTDTQPIARLIRDMQESHSHCAVVVDEHGTTIGLAFLEDALEEIVGPIYDEFDVASVASAQQPDGSVEIAGDMALPAAEQLLSLHDAGDFDTIGGLVAAELGRLPKQGEEVDIEPYRVTVLRVRRNRIERLRFLRK